MNGIIVDSFAGGGGASLGIERALGRPVTVAINHDAAAIAMHKANHPKTRHFTEDVWKVSPRVVTKGKAVGLLWASPDCKHFSRAKGSKPVEKRIRSLAWVVIKWAAEAKPAVIMLENVREFEEWGPLVPRWSCPECDWVGTEGQAQLLRQRHGRYCPRCDGRGLVAPLDAEGNIMCGEAPVPRIKRGKPIRPVVDAKTREHYMIPDPARKGLTFRRWVGRLKNLGYKVEWKPMNAADFGAPTHRRRLFLVARRDGKPIAWPAPTHCDPKKVGKDLFDVTLKPWRTAAECIDWNIPVPSIFERKRPLAEATMKRIAHGIKRYVLDCPAVPGPFIVGVGGRMGQTQAASVQQPHNTVTAKNDRSVIVPYLAPVTHQGDRRGSGADEPLPTVTTAHRGEQALFAATMVQTGYGERVGQAPRTLDLGAPMGTAVDGCKQGLVAAFLAKHYGGHTTPGSSLRKPVDTITTQDHNAVVAANLIHMNHGDKQWSGLEEPVRTLTTGKHAALVYSFLVKYFGTSLTQAVSAPMGTATTKDHLGLVLVVVNGETYVIVDIGMRMLEPRELARGQGFPDSYILTGTKTNQVARIGNSVSPQPAEALVRANFVGMEA